MQLMDVRLAPEGQMMTVEFVGEGGEVVSVTMSNAEGKVTSQNASQHAKAIMLQLATFEHEDDSAPTA